MKIQTPTEFLTFKDGICDIYSVSGNKLANVLIPKLCFGNRIVGMKRYYAARAASTEITRIIQVPQRLDISALNNVVIDSLRYKIEQVQQLDETNPCTTVLTLSKIGVVT